MNQTYGEMGFVPDYPPPPFEEPQASGSNIASETSGEAWLGRLVRRPMFIATVLIPNLLAILYFGLIASPVYVSTASLVVLNPQKAGPSLSSLLAGASGDSSEEGGYLLKNYFGSWQAFTKIEQPLKLADNFREGDFVGRYAGLSSLFRDNDVALWRYLGSRVSVDIDQKSGIVTLRTEAYRPGFAFALTNALLGDGVAHMDAMNSQQEQDFVGSAIAREARIEQALQRDLSALARYRVDSGTYDPKELYTSYLSVLSSLALKKADLASQRDAISAATPNNPVVHDLGSQISSLQGEIVAARNGFPQMAHGSAAYERLLVSRDNHISLLNQANLAVQDAQLNAEKNRYYLNVISTPSQPQTPEEPRRMLWIGGILLCSLLLWGILR